MAFVSTRMGGVIMKAANFVPQSLIMTKHNF